MNIKLGKSIIILFVVLSIIGVGVFWEYHKKKDKVDVSMKSSGGSNQKKDPVRLDKNRLIIAKYSASEPEIISKGELKGKGWMELFAYDRIVESFKKDKLPFDIRSLTATKIWGHLIYRGYTVCVTDEDFPKKKFSGEMVFVKENQTYQIRSIPAYFGGINSKITILKEQFHLFKPYLFPETDILDLKKIFLKSRLKMARIKSWIYDFNNFLSENSHRIPDYNKRIYDFVTSGSIQMPHMLIAKRMDFMDFVMWPEYIIRKAKLNPELFLDIPYSMTHPSKNNENQRIFTFFCSGQNKQLLKRASLLINKSILDFRGDLDHIEKVAQNFFEAIGGRPIKAKDWETMKYHIEMIEEKTIGKFDYSW